MALQSLRRLSHLFTTALLLVLFGYFLHRGRIIALTSLTSCILIISYWMWRSPYEELRRTFAFHRAPPARLIIAALLAVAFGTLLRWLQDRTLFPSQLQPFLLMAMAIGVTEELIFRGYFLGRLADDWHPAVAILLSALFHSAYKTSIFVYAAPLEELVILFVITFLFGLLLGRRRIKSGSLWPCICFHALFDFWVYGDRMTPWWVW